jgi:hypothetical protein
MTQRPQPVVTHALIAAVLTSGVALAAYLWPAVITAEATLLITAFGNSVIILGIALFATKNQVTPVSDPVLPEGTPVKTTTEATTPDATVTSDGV